MNHAAGRPALFCSRLRLELMELLRRRAEMAKMAAGHLGGGEDFADSGIDLSSKHNTMLLALIEN
jgi:hypothetical protein